MIWFFKIKKNIIENGMLFSVHSVEINIHKIIFIGEWDMDHTVGSI